MSQDPSDLAHALVDAGRALAPLMPATSGNLSARLPGGRLLVTASGLDKGALTTGDLLALDADLTSPDGRRPSAETRLHALIYETFPDVGAVLHVHSPRATVLSRHAGDAVVLDGWEIQKAFAGQTTHDARLVVPVVPNDQDMGALAAAAAPRLRAPDLAPGLLIAGHGLYAWGATVAEARRHIDAFEFLFECLLLERALLPLPGAAP